MRVEVQVIDDQRFRADANHEGISNQKFQCQELPNEQPLKGEDCWSGLS
jgi:hypothetical protein